MNNKFLIGISIAIGLLAAAGFFAWQYGLFSGSDSTILDENLPPAPAGYNTLNEDPAVVAEIPEDRLQEYRNGFDEIIATIGEHPDSFGAWFNLGSIKHFLGDYKGAEGAWLYATEISPNQARSLMNLADLYGNTYKDYKQAEWAYFAAIDRRDLSVDQTNLYRELASLYRYSYVEKHGQAISILQVGMENTENPSELLALAGMWAWEDGNFEEAETYYEQFLILNPNQEEAKKDLARIRNKEPLVSK